MFDFARSVTQSRKQSLSETASASPAAAAAAVHSGASLHLPALPLTWSTDNVTAALPLLPGRYVDIAVRVNAVDEWSVLTTYPVVHMRTNGCRAVTDICHLCVLRLYVSCGLEYNVCYAADKLDRSYRVMHDKVRWDVLPGLACSHVAVLPALQRPTSASAAAPSLPLHLLLDIANRADVDLVLHVDVDLTSHNASDRGDSTSTLPPRCALLCCPRTSLVHRFPMFTVVLKLRFTRMLHVSGDKAIEGETSLDTACCPSSTTQVRSHFYCHRSVRL